jgi:GTP-binding protein Era
MVFLDTPGIHKPMHRMNQRMVDAALDTLRDADVVVLVVDAASPPGAGDRFVLERLESVSRPVILALNKIDLVKKTALLPLIESYTKARSLHAVVPISAVAGDGVDALENEVLAALPEGEPLFPEDYLTDQSQRSLAAETIREKLLHHTRDELPFTTAVVIDRFEEPSSDQKLFRIHASILVETASQKPIVVGKGGEMVKRVGTEARYDLEKQLGGRVFLDLHVKVRGDWRDDDRLLDEMGMRRG